MAEDRPITPEKQLLNLIEDPKAVKPVSLNKAALEHKGRSLFSMGSLRGVFSGRLSFFKRTTQKKIHSAKFSVNLIVLNRALGVVAVCLLGYVLFDVGASAMSLNRPANFAFQKEKSTPVPSGEISPLKEGAYYVQKIASRDIFRVAGKPVKAAEEKKEVFSADKNEATKSLSLVGISWSSNPDVIIEDKSSQRTFFVKRGQMVGDGVKIEAIFKDHVVLSYNGEEFELR